MCFIERNRVVDEYILDIQVLKNVQNVQRFKAFKEVSKDDIINFTTRAQGKFDSYDVLRHKFKKSRWLLLGTKNDFIISKRSRCDLIYGDAFSLTRVFVVKRRSGNVQEFKRLKGSRKVQCVQLVQRSSNVQNPKIYCFPETKLLHRARLRSERRCGSSRYTSCVGTRRPHLTGEGLLRRINRA